jgi:hypothetical protein
MSKRRHYVKVSLSDQEAARLDELRGGQGRAVFMRQLLYEPPDGRETCTHGESVALLSASARAGKVAAQITLERALRGGEQPLGELEEFLRGG